MSYDWMDNPLRKLRASFDSDEAQVELTRLSKGMDQKIRARFAAQLEAVWQDSQARVHILSGALRSSGRRYISRSTSKKWRGTITYGGYSKVPRFVSQTKQVPRQGGDAHTVDYAAIENNKPGHEFFDEDVFTYLMDNIMIDAADWLSGDPKLRRAALRRTNKAVSGYKPRAAKRATRRKP